MHAWKCHYARFLRSRWLSPSAYFVASSFLNLMRHHPRVSATNIATVYNYATAPSASPVRPIHQPLHLLTSRTVLDAFFLHALLQDKYRDDEVLVLPHEGPHEHRFDTALRDRNAKIRRRGQEMWGHACDDCVKRMQRPDGTVGKHFQPCISVHAADFMPPIAYVSAGVTDGVTVGHPCCAVLNCQQDLVKGRDRYCERHRSKDDVCAVEGCVGRTTRGYLTCLDASHRAWEAKHRRRQRTTAGAAFTILSDRYRASNNASTTTASIPPNVPKELSNENEISHFATAASSTSTPNTSHTPLACKPDTGDADPSPSSSSSSTPAHAFTPAADLHSTSLAPSQCHPPHSHPMTVPEDSSTLSQPIPLSPTPYPSNPSKISIDSRPPVESFKGRIYRRWTHNEQLFVCCCGVILSRATFFGSEGILGVVVSTISI